MFHFAHLSLISSLALQIVRTIITSGVKYFSLLLDRFDLYYNELLSLVSLFIFVVSLSPLLIYISPLCVYSQFTFQLLLTFPFYLCVLLSSSSSLFPLTLLCRFTIHLLFRLSSLPFCSAFTLFSFFRFSFFIYRYRVSLFFSLSYISRCLPAFSLLLERHSSTSAF